MILKVFTNANNPETAEAINLAKNLEEEGNRVEYYDLDGDEAHQLAEIFDIYISPSFAITQDDGREIHVWRGLIPLNSELTNYLRS